MARSSGVSPYSLRGFTSAPNAIRAFRHSVLAPCCIHGGGGGDEKRRNVLYSKSRTNQSTTHAGISGVAVLIPGWVAYPPGSMEEGNRATAYAHSCSNLLPGYKLVDLTHNYVGFEAVPGIPSAVYYTIPCAESSEGIVNRL